MHFKIDSKPPNHEFNCSHALCRNVTKNKACFINAYIILSRVLCWIDIV